MYILKTNRFKKVISLLVVFSLLSLNVFALGNVNKSDFPNIPCEYLADLTKSDLTMEGLNTMNQQIAEYKLSDKEIADYVMRITKGSGKGAYPKDKDGNSITPYGIVKVTKVIEEKKNPDNSVKAPVNVTTPTFKVTLNGEVMDNENNKYPLLVYKDITYFPMTYYGARFLGLKANWYEKPKYYSYEGVLFIGVCPENEKQSTLEMIKNDSKKEEKYTATIVDYGLALNTTTQSQFLNNATEEYPILNFRGISYFPLTWKFAVEEFGWKYSYTNQDGLVINSGDAFRPLIDDVVIANSMPSENARYYFYSDNYYVVYPYSSYRPVYKLQVRKRGGEEKQYDMESQLYNGRKYSILYLNHAKDENGSFVESKPTIKDDIFYLNCIGSEKNSKRTPDLEIVIGIDLKNGKIVSEELKK